MFGLGEFLLQAREKLDIYLVVSGVIGTTCISKVWTNQQFGLAACAKAVGPSTALELPVLGQVIMLQLSHTGFSPVFPAL